MYTFLKRQRSKVTTLNFFGKFLLLKLLMQSFSVNREDNSVKLHICAAMYDGKLLLSYE